MQCHDSVVCLSVCLKCIVDTSSGKVSEQVNRIGYFSGTAAGASCINIPLRGSISAVPVTF